MNIRRAEVKDLERINALLYQVAKIHADGRPDLFKAATKKYSDAELCEIIADDSKPIFVAVDGDDCVLGYAFCVYQITEENLLLHGRRVLYIDDLCVDEAARGGHIGTALYDYVLAFAKEKGFDSVTLNVWSFNESAVSFYKKLGMKEQKTVMEAVL